MQSAFTSLKFLQHKKNPQTQIKKPAKNQTPKPEVTYSFMSHLDAPCCWADAPQFRLTAPSAVLTLGFFQEKTDTCQIVKFSSGETSAGYLEAVWTSFSFVTKETWALLCGSETRIFILIEEILPPTPLNFFVKRILLTESI